MANSKRKYPQVKPKRHGGYSLIVAGEDEKHRAYLLRHLTECREGICRDLGGEVSMTMAQVILVDRVVSKLGIVRCIEEYVRENGIFDEKRLAPTLKESYLAYSNSIRLNLQALGIQKKTSEQVLKWGESMVADLVDKKGGDGGEK